jgi:hypothetical protein
MIATAVAVAASGAVTKPARFIAPQTRGTGVRFAHGNPRPPVGGQTIYTLEVEGERNRNAAWTYRHPLPWMRKIRDHVAFWNGVEVRP